MSILDPALALPAFLVLSTWATFLPQARRVVRRGAAGVSPEAWAAMLAGRVTMVAYGVVFADPVQIVSASVPAVASAVILVAALRSSASHPGQSRRASLWGFYALVLASVSVLEQSALYSRVLVSASLVGVAAMSSVPQFMRVLRVKDRSGVSVATWTISAVSSAAWVVHGILGGFAAVIVASMVWLVASVAVVVATLRPCDESLTG